MKEDFSPVGCFTQVSAQSREICYYANLLFHIHDERSVIKYGKCVTWILTFNSQKFLSIHLQILKDRKKGRCQISKLKMFSKKFRKRKQDFK